MLFIYLTPERIIEKLIKKLGGFLFLMTKGLSPLYVVSMLFAEINATTINKKYTNVATTHARTTDR